MPLPFRAKLLSIFIRINVIFIILNFFVQLCIEIVRFSVAFDNATIMCHGQIPVIIERFYSNKITLTKFVQCRVLTIIRHHPITFTFRLQHKHDGHRELHVYTYMLVKAASISNTVSYGPSTAPAKPTSTTSAPLPAPASASRSSTRSASASRSSTCSASTAPAAQVHPQHRARAPACTNA